MGATALLGVVCILWCSCHAGQNANGVVHPVVEFTNVPLAEAGNPEKLEPIKGRVIHPQQGQSVVLYSKAGNTWWVQPFTNKPLTRIQPNSKWINSTHPGTDYAALLVGPDFRPPPKTDVLPTAGVLSFAVTRGQPVFWQTRWFPFLCLTAGALTILGFHRLRLYQATRRLKVGFEERLAERMRVAQELHDTFLQGVLSASMQLHVAVDQMPADSPAQPALNHVLELMGQVVEEGRTTVKGLRSSIANPRDLEYSFSRVPQEFKVQQKIDFRIIVEGPVFPLQPAVRNDIYRIGREALANAFRHSQASKIELELEYAASQLRLLVRDNGRGIDAQQLHLARTERGGLSNMRERAQSIGAKLKVSSSRGSGTEVELRVPSRLAFESYRLHRASNWLTVLHARDQHARDLGVLDQAARDLEAGRPQHEKLAG